MPDNALLDFLDPQAQDARWRAQDPEYVRELDAYEKQRKPVMPFNPQDVQNFLKLMSNTPWWDLITGKVGSRGIPGVDGSIVPNLNPSNYPAPASGGVRGSILDMLKQMAA